MGIAQRGRIGVINRVEAGFPVVVSRIFGRIIRWRLGAFESGRRIRGYRSAGVPFRGGDERDPLSPD